MSYTVGPQLQTSDRLTGGQALRASWRRSAAATAAEIASGSLFDGSLEELYGKLDERLPQASMYRASPPTLTADTVTLDLKCLTNLPNDYTAGAAAHLLDELVTGLPLVNLQGRTVVAGEGNRATDREAAAVAGQQAAEAQSVSTLFSKIAGKAELIFAGVVILAVVIGAIYFLPHTGGKKAE